MNLRAEVCVCIFDVRAWRVSGVVAVGWRTGCRTTKAVSVAKWCVWGGPETKGMAPLALWDTGVRVHVRGGPQHIEQFKVWSVSAPMRRGGSRTECVGDHHDATVILDADDARAGHDGVRGALHPPELGQSRACVLQELFLF